jgi:hypothetical protein
VIPQPETVVSDGDEILALAVKESEPLLRAAILGSAVDEPEL